MKKICLWVMLLLFFRNSNAQVTMDTIRWSKSYRISWSDFKAKPDTLDKVHSAVSVCSGAYRFFLQNGKHFFETWSLFYRDQSFYREGYVDSQTLIHERGHFDIAEVFARKLRLAFSRYILDVNHYKKDIEAI